jgi:hypothetical protein
MRKTGANEILKLIPQKYAMLRYRGIPRTAALQNIKSIGLPILTYGMGIWLMY